MLLQHRTKEVGLKRGTQKLCIRQSLLNSNTKVRLFTNYNYSYPSLAYPYYLFGHGLSMPNGHNCLTRSQILYRI